MYELLWLLSQVDWQRDPVVPILGQSLLLDMFLLGVSYRYFQYTEARGLAETLQARTATNPRAGRKRNGLFVSHSVPVRIKQPGPQTSQNASIHICFLHSRPQHG